MTPADSPTPLEQAERAVQALREVAQKGDVGPREMRAALAVAKDLESGVFHAMIQRAAREFAEGGADDEAASWALLGFESRLLLEVISQETSDAALIDALCRADEALEPYGDAVLLIADDEFEAVRGSTILDEETWWGRRSALSAALPVREVVRALQQGRRAESRMVSAQVPRQRLRRSQYRGLAGLAVALVALCVIVGGGVWYQGVVRQAEAERAAALHEAAYKEAELAELRRALEEQDRRVAGLVEELAIAQSEDARAKLREELQEAQTQRAGAAKAIRGSGAHEAPARPAGQSACAPGDPLCGPL